MEIASGYALTLAMGLAFGCWMGLHHAWNFAVKLRRFGIEPADWHRDGREKV